MHIQYWLYISDDVFRYLKGRLTYAQLNSAVDQLDQVLAGKYKILGTKRLGMGENIMKKYRVCKFFLILFCFCLSHVKV